MIHAMTLSIFKYTCLWGFLWENKYDSSQRQTDPRIMHLAEGYTNKFIHKNT